MSTETEKVFPLSHLLIGTALACLASTVRALRQHIVKADLPPVILGGTVGLMLSGVLLALLLGALVKSWRPYRSRILIVVLTSVTFMAFVGEP